MAQQDLAIWTAGREPAEIVDPNRRVGLCTQIVRNVPWCMAGKDRSFGSKKKGAKESSKLLALEQRISRLENELALKSSGQHHAAGPARILKIHIARSTLARKPFAVTLELVGVSRRITRSLTAVRTAIFLVLLLDFMKEREHRGGGDTRLSQIQQTVKAILPEEKCSPESVRVAMYRASQFLREEFAESDKFRILLEDNSLAIKVFGSTLKPREIEIELSSPDQALSAFFDRCLETSPLQRLRKSKALYVPGGPEGQDRLILELVDHPGTVRETTLFYRPTILTHPSELLVRLGVSAMRRKRIDVLLKGMSEGRIRHTEILQRNTLQNLAKREPDGNLSFYPQGANETDILAHVDHLIFLVQSQPNFELVITDAFFPFYINAMERMVDGNLERYVLFFLAAEPQNTHAVTVFALNDDGTFFTTQDQIIRWILNHPTSSRDRGPIVEELQALRRSLASPLNSKTKKIDDGRTEGRTLLAKGQELFSYGPGGTKL